MSRTALLTSALAALALGAGAYGYAATAASPEEAALDEAVTLFAPLPVPAGHALRPHDRVVDVAPGERIAAALLRAGAGGLDSALAEQAGGGLSGPIRLWLGEEVGTGARAIERIEARVGAGRRIVVEREGDGFARHDTVEAVDSTPVRIRLGQAELAAGLVEAGLPRALRDQLLDRVAGARIAAVDLIVAHEASPSWSGYGQPLYLGVHLADGSIRRWVGGGGGLRLLEDGQGRATGLLRPLPGPVTSNPGLRFHPILRYLRWHRGTDFASPEGTPVQAAQAGRVVTAGWQGGYGRTVRIAHPDGSTTLYAHLSQVAVESGEAVPQGAVIGKVGATGLATGPHLHFEWQRSGETLRPHFAAGEVAEPAVEPAQQRRLQALLSAPFRLPPQRRS